MDEIKTMVESIVKNLIDDTSNVRVNVLNGKTSAIIEVDVAKNEVGKLIGKNGRMVDAIRTLLGGVSNKYRRKINIEIVDKKDRTPQV